MVILSWKTRELNSTNNSINITLHFSVSKGTTELSISIQGKKKAVNLPKYLHENLWLSHVLEMKLIKISLHSQR